ncbi:MAG: DUF3164 family protein [Desulfuromonadales bacterium]|nr:DUF3164 family protein [Desulfuromonadales bacterium]
MNYYSYSPTRGMQYHPTGKEAKEAANLLAIASVDLGLVTWGEVTERATPTAGGGFALKRQERLGYEAEHPQVVDGRMADCDGNLILIQNIHDADLLEHDMVLSVACIWENLSAKIARFKQHNFEDVTTFVDILFDRYAAKRGGSEGNMTFTTVDRKYKLQVAIQKAIAFGPEIEVAKTKMLEAVKEMSDSGDLETIVTATFTQIDGKLRVAEILRLRNYKISNKTWNEAVEIINAAIEVISAKKQIRLYRRNEQGQYDAVPLNIAAI